MRLTFTSKVRSSFFNKMCLIRHIPVKRIFDLCFSIAVVTIGLPVFLLIAMAIAFTSRGPIIYASTRIGRGGRAFKFLKFRTMYRDADLHLKKMLDADPILREEYERNLKLKKDPRVTPLGAFLRRTSLDELPQFFNVIMGHMSVVGPRPWMPHEITGLIGLRAQKIVELRPGLTGLWQVSGRSNTTYHERIRLEEEYVKTQSFWHDIVIIAKTIPSILFRHGAY